MHDLERTIADAARTGAAAASPLAASAVRRVGDRMRRARALATAAAATGTGAVLVAAVALTGPNAGDVEVRPAGTLTAAPTASADPSSPSPVPSTPPSSPEPPAAPAPAPTPSAAGGGGRGDLLVGRLLRSDDLAPVSPDRWRWQERSGVLPRCTPELSDRAVERATVRLTLDENAFYVVAQGAEVFTTDAEAAQRLAELRSSAGRCAEASADVDLFYAFTLTGVGDEGFITETTEVPAPDLEALLPAEVRGELGWYTTTRFARTGRAVTWTLSTVGKQEYLYFPEVDELATAVDRLCGPAGGACTGQTQQLTISYPPRFAGTEVRPGTCFEPC